MKGRDGQPLLVALGASITAGVGASSPRDAWPRVVARTLDWRLVSDGAPGAGFLNPGAEGRGPFRRQLAALGLEGLDTTVVLVQGGRNDVGQPARLLEQRVGELFALIVAQAPAATVGLVGVFPGPEPSAAERQANEVIRESALRAIPGLLVLDPINEGWRFPTVEDGVHPTTAGHHWIAERVVARLREAVPV